MQGLYQHNRQNFADADAKLNPIALLYSLKTIKYTALPPGNPLQFNKL